MRITDVAATKKGRLAIFVDGEFLFSLHPDTYAASRLSIGDETDPQALEDLRCESEIKSAKERALRLLAGQDYTHKQLVEKLRRYTDDEAAREAARRMEELGLIDDADYAMRCARDLVRLRHFSPRRAAQELRRRGVGDEEIEAALAQFEGDDPREAIARIVLKKYPRIFEDEKTEKRAVGGLTRLGYAYGDIRYVLAHFEEFAEPDAFEL